MLDEIIPVALQPENLPPFLRVLLATDGTVTRTLEAFFWQPIAVDVLLHDMMRSSRDYPQIGIERGQHIIVRHVVLRGRDQQVPYALAHSVIASDRLAPAMRSELLERRRGIGELLIEARHRTFREILSVRRAPAGEWAADLEIQAGEPVVIRQYTIDHGLGPSILIEEVFPECRYVRV